MNYKKLLILIFIINIALINKVESAEVKQNDEKSEQLVYIATKPYNDDMLVSKSGLLLKKITNQNLLVDNNKLKLKKQECSSVYNDIQDHINILDSVIDGTQKISGANQLENIINVAYGYEKGSSENIHINKEKEEFSYWVNRKLRSTGNRLAKVVARNEHLKDKKRALTLVGTNQVLNFYGIAGLNLGKILVGGVALYSAYQLYNKQSSLFTRYVCPITLGSIGLYCVYRGIKKTYKLWNYDAIFIQKTDLLDKVGGYLEQKRIWLECVKDQKDTLKDAKYLSHTVDPSLTIRVI